MSRTNINKRPERNGEYDFSTPQAITQYFMLPYIKRDKILLDRISKAQFLQISTVIEIDSQTLSSVIGLRSPTFLLKHTDDLFCGSISENIIDLLEVYSYGYHRCSDPAVFNLWMKDRHPSLASITPFLHCRDKAGRTEVFREISGMNGAGSIGTKSE